MRLGGWLIGAAVSAAAFGALAQTASPVMTIPSQGTTQGGIASSTIASTNTFQKVFSAMGFASGTGAIPRKGCKIINGGTHNMLVTEGIATASATAASALTLAAAGSYDCTQGGVALQGEIAITGTAGDSFYAAQW